MEFREKILLCVVVGILYFAFRRKAKENFATPKTLTYLPQVSYGAHEYALKKFCESEGLVAERFLVPNTNPNDPPSYELRCTIPNSATCLAMNERESTKGSGQVYKWAAAMVPTVKEITASTPPSIKNEEIKKILQTKVDLVNKKFDTEKEQVLTDCYAKKAAEENRDVPSIDDCKVPDSEECKSAKTFIEGCKTSSADKLNEIDRSRNDEIIRVTYLWSSANPTDEKAKAWLAINSARMNKVGETAPSASAYPIPVPTTYTEKEQQKELCVKLPNWMESFCQESNPCKMNQKDAGCAKEEGLIKFAIGNLKCYPEKGYCEPKEFKDAYVANCVMTKDYCDRMDVLYDEAEWTTQCDGNVCTKSVPRGRCYLTDEQLFLENALPIGMTMLRQWKKAGENMARECGQNIAGQACWEAVGLLLASPATLISDTGMKWFAENFNDIKEAWVTAFANPSLYNINKFMESFDKLPTQYVQGKMGEMFDSIIGMIPGIGSIFPSGFCKTFMTRYAGPFWSFYKARALLINAILFGPNIVSYVFDGFSTLEAGVNWILSQTPYVLSQIGSGITTGWDTVSGGLSTGVGYLGEGAGYVSDFFTGKYF